MDIFCIIAMQNLELTEFAIGLDEEAVFKLKSFMIAMSVVKIFLPFVIRYSTPLRVLAMTLTRLSRACCIAGSDIASRSRRN